MYLGHCITIYKNRIYDAAEIQSMPLERSYLDRCVRESAADTDTFYQYRNIVIFRPKPKLLRSIHKRLAREESASAAPAAKRMKV